MTDKPGNVASRVQEIRDQIGLKQSDLVTILNTLDGPGWNQTRVSRLERSPQDATFGELEAIAQALGVNDPLELLPRRVGGGVVGEIERVWLSDERADLEENVRLVRRYLGQHSWHSPADRIDVPDVTNFEELLVLGSRKPRLAFLGSFDVGKSTLVNTVLGRDLVPARYQPTTRLVTELRHVDDRPAWFDADVMLLSEGYDPALLDDRNHTERHLVGQSSLDDLERHATHGTEEVEGAFAAVVFVDADVLKLCVLLDLPGVDNDVQDNAKAESPAVAFDAAVFADAATGFLGLGTLTRLAEVIRRLPGRGALPGSPFGNMLIVATHAHPAIGDASLEEILNHGAERAARYLGDSVLTEGVFEGQDLQTVLRSRLIPFYKDLPRAGLGEMNRRDAFLDAVASMISQDLPSAALDRLAEDAKTLRAESAQQVERTIQMLEAARADRETAQADLERLVEDDPKFQLRLAKARRDVAHEITYQSRELASWYRSDDLARLWSVESIEALLEEAYGETSGNADKKRDRRKEAQENAAGLVIERIQNASEERQKRATKKVIDKVNDFLGQFEAAAVGGPQGAGRIKMSFDARGAFAGGLAGLVGVGALYAWASTLGNLGAYIIVAKAVSALSALGVSTGGVAVWTAGLAAIGGPVTAAVAIVVSATLVGLVLIRGSWEKRLSKAIHKKLEEQDLPTQLVKASNAYWDETLKAFEAGADEVEAKWYKHIANLREVLNDYDEAELVQHIGELGVLLDAYQGIPDVQRADA